MQPKLSRVIESKEETLPIGSKVVGPLNCTSHAVIPGKMLTKMDFLDDLPISVGVGAAGMPGYDFLYIEKVGMQLLPLHAHITSVFLTNVTHYIYFQHL